MEVPLLSKSTPYINWYFYIYYIYVGRYAILDLAWHRPKITAGDCVLIGMIGIYLSACELNHNKLHHAIAQDVI